MVQLAVIHSMLADPETYRRHYFETHVPLVKSLTGLRKYDVNDGAITTPVTNAATFLVAMTHFDDLAPTDKALQSPEGQATAAEMPNFAREGDIQLVMFES